MRSPRFLSPRDAYLRTHGRFNFIPKKSRKSWGQKTEKSWGQKTTNHDRGGVRDDHTDNEKTVESVPENA